MSAVVGEFVDMAPLEKMIAMEQGYGVWRT